MHIIKSGVVLLALVIAGCTTAPPAPVAPITPPPIPSAGPGLERIIGQTTKAATALIGKPTLDRREGPGHHLQFARSACILDVYYYPDKAGNELAGFAEARRADGLPREAGDCLAAILSASSAK